VHAEDALEAGAHGVRDRRFGEKWTPAQALKNGFIRSALRGLSFFVDRLPPGLLLLLCAFAGKVAYRLLGRARRHVQRRVAASLPGADANRVARACFENAGKNLGLSLLLRRRNVRASDFVAFSAASRSVLEQALASGRGALVVSAHIGPFEMIPAVLVEHGFSPAVVVRESYDPALDAAVDAHRRARGVEVIHRGNEHAALRIARALRDGRPVGMLLDVRSRGVASTKARFLGQTVLFPAGVERLASRLRCAVIVGTLASRMDGAPSFELRFETLDGVESSAHLTQRVAHMLSRAILRSPEHWLWMGPAHVSIADDSASSLFSRVAPSSELDHA
jgi:KDO2-lipid IV(A) lauroyltransferase